MKVYRSISEAARNADITNTGCVVTIGNFDGVHLGHQAMLSAARDKALRHNLPLLVLSFDPHPIAYFQPDAKQPRLSSFGERVLALKKLGVDIACIVPFNQDLASLSHRAFVEKILDKSFNAKFVVIGDDFKYGKNREGSVDTLIQSSKRCDFQVEQLTSIEHSGQRISSTQIRTFLNDGNLDSATRYLGNPYTITGRVVHGDARGRTWGFPTLNLPMKIQRALSGVFAVEVSGLQAKTLQGVANIGMRPTVGELKYLLEIHLFDYNSDAYGKRVCVAFRKRIRAEKKFDSFDALKAQIARDIQTAKNYFPR